MTCPNKLPMLSSSSVQIQLCRPSGPALSRAPRHLLVVFCPPDSLCCLLQLWTDRVGARGNTPLVSPAASERGGVLPGTERPLAPQLPGPVFTVGFSAPPGKLRTRDGHLQLPQELGCLHSLTRSFQNPLPFCSAAGARMTRVYPLESSAVEGTRSPSSDSGVPDSVLTHECL